ncbi:helix-turn-helix transcriptional regulator [Marinilongibacter aquaticus]|uniref:winged helix-turn-helix transcriptional regulator n=1 Tax=Marinilongibacter aquaticus TaxID=2975157 RepID=UPI0021BD6958|nr:helix-turn-helix domain-containing protein [Marinilongibacter aquaticus]UBM59542.1 helix-turn-helix transcriptional regulator [Marinilongibacter aquaticus]
MEGIDKMADCPVTQTLELIGTKWKPLILYYLSFGTKRFGELAVRLPNISRKVLTEQLRQLEQDELVSRKQYKEIPPRVEYSLTELGHSLSPVFKEMEIWGRERLQRKKDTVEVQS